jgi:hypothetical protein
MDRRELLKRLAAGGVLAAGSPLIISSPAFADSGTVKCTPTNCATPVSFTTAASGGGPGANWIVLSVTSPTATTCGATYTPSIEYRYRVSGLSDGIAVPVVRNAARSAVLATTGAWSAFTTAGSVTITNNSTAANLNNATNAGKRYTIEVIARSICTRGGTKCWCCRGYVMANGTWNTVYTPGSQGSFSVASADCDSPAP